MYVAPKDRVLANKVALEAEQHQRRNNERARRAALAMARVHAAGEDARTARLMRAIFGVNAFEEGQ